MLDCPTCGASVRFAQFRRPVYGDSRESFDPSRPQPLRTVSDTVCDNGHELELRDGTRLLPTGNSGAEQ